MTVTMFLWLLGSKRLWNLLIITWFNLQGSSCMMTHSHIVTIDQNTSAFYNYKPLYKSFGMTSNGTPIIFTIVDGRKRANKHWFFCASERDQLKCFWKLSCCIPWLVALSRHYLKPGSYEWCWKKIIFTKLIKIHWSFVLFSTIWVQFAFKYWLPKARVSDNWIQLSQNTQ